MENTVFDKVNFHKKKKTLVLTISKLRAYLTKLFYIEETSLFYLFPWPLRVIRTEISCKFLEFDNVGPPLSIYV